MYTLILFSALSFGQCENGVCRVPVRERIVEKTKTVVVEKQPVRTLARRVVHHERRVFLRRR